MSPAEFSHIGLLGWCMLAVDGVQTMMELAEVGKSGC